MMPVGDPEAERGHKVFEKPRAFNVRIQRARDDANISHTEVDHESESKLKEKNGCEREKPSLNSDGSTVVCSLVIRLRIT